jgi:peptide/nickel transport system permease protein
MARYLLWRLGYSVIVIIGVSVVVFVVTYAIGDPAKLMLPLEATQEEYELFRERMGLNRPMHVQFWDFASNALRGDFGNSVWQRTPALNLVLERLPATLQLCVTAMLLSLGMALALGVVAALRPGSLLDRLATVISLIGVSVPGFWLGLVLIIVFAVNLGWLRSSGYGDWRHLVLPAVTLAALSGGRITQIVRSTMIDELAKPYIVSARSKGVAEAVIVGRHALRNAAIPIITLAAWELVRMLAGYTVPVEVVFAWPGVGQLAMQAILRHDLPLIQADVFVVALFVLAINLVVDVSYAFVDPRVRLE